MLYASHLWKACWAREQPLALPYRRTQPTGRCSASGTWCWASFPCRCKVCPAACPEIGGAARIFKEWFTDVRTSPNPNLSSTPNLCPNNNPNPNPNQTATEPCTHPNSHLNPNPNHHSHFVQCVLHTISSTIPHHLLYPGPGGESSHQRKDALAHADRRVGRVRVPELLVLSDRRQAPNPNLTLTLSLTLTLNLSLSLSLTLTRRGLWQRGPEP